MRTFIMIVIFGTAASFCVSATTHNYYYLSVAAMLVTALLAKIADLLMEIRDKL